ncbi:MAG: penicillin acylase family protein [Gemmataceae bacterium]|nr:penicillin acylase family protein [Gemmataceae bacterium]
MKPTDQEMLRRLGSGETIDTLCTAAGLSRAQFDAWWKAQVESRVPAGDGTRRAMVQRAVCIERDRWGIPHVRAESDRDLFFGFGYAMAQDRLFQLDFLRRRGAGRLAAVLGADGTELDVLGRTVGFRSILELDVLARTVGIRRIAEAEWGKLAEETQTLLKAFSDGVNALMDETRDRLPIEFDLLDYRPEPWSPIDCLAIEGEFRWYLTGRFPVIVMPELARRALGDGPLFRAFLTVERDDESILPPGSYTTERGGAQPVGAAAGDPQGTHGSNNWVLDGRRTATGKPLVASDPHIWFDAVSCWYEVHLNGGSFQVAGMSYVGIPAVMFGRTERVAWGCTNNICSQRDLYEEKTDTAHPDCFLHNDCWEPARTLEEIVPVRGAEPERRTIRFSRNGPIVNDVLPPVARGGAPVALKWLGAHQGGWLTALLAMDRARSAAEFREATRAWHVPAFSLVFGDVDGAIGYQSVGRIPIRNVWQRGYRPGWDPQHQWQGLIPFEGMPRWADPERGWIATANNRPAPEDFPYPLSGTWADCLRALRIRQMIEETPKVNFNDCIAMHYDSLSLRAVHCLPHLLPILGKCADSRVQKATTHLASWDGRMEPDRVGATLFDVFFLHWTRAVALHRFDADTAALLAGGAAGLAAALLEDDRCGWFSDGVRERSIHEAMIAALDWLTPQLGPDLNQWTWGRLHVVPLRHVLSGRGDLGQLLDHGGVPVPGDGITVCNTGLGRRFEANAGANYRLIADLSTSPPGLWAVDSQSQSGHPGSPHYADQLPEWLHGRYHYLPLDGAEASAAAVSRLTLEPRGII